MSQDTQLKLHTVLISCDNKNRTLQTPEKSNWKFRKQSFKLLLTYMQGY